MGRKANVLRVTGLLLLSLLVAVPAVAARGSVVGALTMLLLCPSTECETAHVWISRNEIRDLPQKGDAWENVLAAAGEAVSSPVLGDANSDDDVHTMAKALVYVATGDETYRTRVVSIIRDIQGTESTARVVELGKNLPAYIIAAELVGLPEDAEVEFRDWLSRLLDDFADCEGKTLKNVFTKKPNNWGTLGTAARATIAAYLGLDEELGEIATLFEAWMGNEALAEAHDIEFQFSDPMEWHADATRPKGVNSAGAERMVDLGDGYCTYNLDGVVPDDQRRVTGGFDGWECGTDAPQTNYVYTSLQGVVVLAVILSRAGYDPWHWEDRAILRAFRWLCDQASYPAEDNDVWMLYVVNHYYGDDPDFVPFDVPAVAEPGKNMAWTDWTYGCLNGCP